MAVSGPLRTARILENKNPATRTGFPDVLKANKRDPAQAALCSGRRFGLPLQVVDNVFSKVVENRLPRADGIAPAGIYCALGLNRADIPIAGIG